MATSVRHEVLDVRHFFGSGPTLRQRRSGLANTDADSEVPHDWIAAQLRMRRKGAQVWVGGVRVCDWSDRTSGTAEAWRSQYESETLPISSGPTSGSMRQDLPGGRWFRECGHRRGDRDLFKRALALGAAIRHDPLVRVVTSGRRDGRAPRGFADALTSIEAVLPVPDIGQAELTAS